MAPKKTAAPKAAPDSGPFTVPVDEIAHIVSFALAELTHENQHAGPLLLKVKNRIAGAEVRDASDDPNKRDAANALLAGIVDALKPYLAR